MKRQSPIDLEQDRAEASELANRGIKTSISDPPAATANEPVKSKKKTWIWFLVFACCLAGAVFFAWPKLKSTVFTEESSGKSAKQSKSAEDGIVSVVAAKAQRGSIGVYYTALGAVTPIYTVTVKSRVDGQLMKVLFKEGQTVRQGDELLEIDTRPYQAALDQMEAQLARDQTQLKNARLDLERYKNLVKSDAIPEQQLATQDALVDQYVATVKSDQASVDTAKLNVVYCHITSPINGLIGLRLVDPGNIVHATDMNGMLVITQMDPISVIFTLAEDQLPTVLDKMRTGQTLAVEAWDRDLKNKLTSGALQTIDNQIDPTTGTLKLRANFDNHEGKLFPSQFVNARLLIEQKRGITVVPNAAIQRNAQDTYVWLIDADDTAHVHPVTVGVSEGEQTQVVSGLQPGDSVVTVGVDRLQEGSKVSVEVPSGKQPKNAS